MSTWFIYHRSTYIMYVHSRTEKGAIAIAAEIYGEQIELLSASTVFCGYCDPSRA